ncbi:MAG: IS481 family transposase, partial [Stecheria intestinalis]|nr:IS481 family transposase [Stecheria intestinalis]
MSSPKTEDWQNTEALRRFQMIAPLMDQTLDSAKKTATRRTIAEDNGISVKTIRRYESAFRSKGFSGLMPKSRKGSIDRRLPENYSEFVQEAIILKKEVPSRSVSQIITILEGERKAPEGVLKRSTLQRHLYAAGFGEKQMKKYREDQRSTAAVKRFCKPHRMMLA